MQFIENVTNRKKIKLSDDELLDLVRADRDEAERYFCSNLADAIVFVLKFRQQLVKQFPAFRSQSSATNLVSWECGMIDEQTVQACLLQQIATNRASRSGSHNQDIYFLHLGFLNIHSI